MIVIYLRITYVNFLHENFSILKLDEYLKLLATNTYEKTNIHPNEPLRQLCVVPLDKNFVK
jgi:hypothetical protein